MQENDFLQDTRVPKLLLAANVVLALFYFLMIAFFFQRGNAILFWLLIGGEIFHLWQAITFIYTIWETDHTAPRDDSYTPPVDIFIPVAGEPVDVIEATVQGALAMDYPNFKIYILNDGFVAKKANWKEVEELAGRLGVNCITRTVPGGAKAGNINTALAFTANPFITFFDADHVPEPEFLRETMPYFIDEKLAYVQTPQFYKNQDLNHVAGGSWEQQSLFFGPICKGKNRLNSVTMCGTNMVVRRVAMEEAGGMYEKSIAEDFVTGFLMHKNGWRSLYVPKILARGLAPEDFMGYYKQQARWARGSLDLLLHHNILFTRKLTGAQKIQYLSSASYFLSGWVVAMNALIPITYFFTGQFPILTSTMALASIFIPYMLTMLYIIQRSSNFSYTYRAIAFSMAGFHVHMMSSIGSLFGHKAKFSVTPKKKQSGNFTRLVIPQIMYLLLSVVGAGYAIFRANGVITAAWIANFAWSVINSAIFIEYIRAALPSEKVAPALAAAPTPAFAVQQSHKRNRE